MAVQVGQMIEGPDITNYWQYFNLDRDPFAMNAEEALIYLPPYWEEMLDLIQYLAHYKNQLVVVTADSGIGKTTLSELLSVQLGESMHVVKISAEPNLDAKRFIEFLSDAFTVSWQPDQTIEQALDQQLQAFQHKERNCLLLVDNAQLLPTETLEALLYFVGQQSDSQMRFHAVLFGEIVLQLTLQRMLEPSEENLIHFLSLEPLSLEETAQYLNHRLSASGWQNENPMSEEIVARIFRLSEGNAARVNRIARRFLLDMLNDQNHAAQKGIGRTYGTRLLGACLIIAILAALGLWAWRVNNTAVMTAPIRPIISVNGQPLLHEQMQPLQALPPVVSKPIPVVQKKYVTAISSTTMPPAKVVSVKTVPIKQQEMPLTTRSSLTPIISGKTTTTASVPSTTVRPVRHVVSVKKHETLPKVLGGDYAIQLIALNQSKNIDQFIKENHLKGKVTIKKIMKQGQPLTVVLYGHYSTLHEAERAIPNLPENLQNAKPWPRKISG